MKEKSRIYLDNAASTPIDSAVSDVMIPYIFDHFGNPSSLHENGRKTTLALSKARFHVSKLIGAKPNEIYFTSGGTESNNMALIGYSKAVKKLKPADRKSVV